MRAGLRPSILDTVVTHDSLKTSAAPARTGSSPQVTATELHLGSQSTVITVQIRTLDGFSTRPSTSCCSQALCRDSALSKPAADSQEVLTLNWLQQVAVRTKNLARTYAVEGPAACAALCAA